MPTAKSWGGYGSIDFDIGVPYYHHDTRTFIAPGGGIEYRIWHDLWARGDYQYQFWTDFGRGTIEPQGVTVGVSYALGHPHLRHRRFQ